MKCGLNVTYFKWIIPFGVFLRHQMEPVILAKLASPWYTFSGWHMRVNPHAVSVLGLALGFSLTYWTAAKRVTGQDPEQWCSVEMKQVIMTILTKVHLLLPVNHKVGTASSTEPHTGLCPDGVVESLVYRKDRVRGSPRFAYGNSKCIYLANLSNRWASLSQRMESCLIYNPFFIIRRGKD